MLTGAPPFTGDSSVGIAYRHVHEDPGPPSARRPGLPAPLDEITTRLLAKDPAARPPGAAAARMALLAATGPDRTAVLDALPGSAVPGPPPRRPRWRPRPAEAVLAIALAAALAALVGVLAAGPAGTAAGPAASPDHPAATGQASLARARPSPTAVPGASYASELPPAAAAAAAFVGDLEAGVASGQVTQQAGQDLFNHLQQLLFGPPGQDSQQVDQQYAQLIQAYDQDQIQGQITGSAAATLRHALDALGVAVGAL
jgi:serine/threonine-protein kinase